MKIHELDLVMQNKHLLDEEDTSALESFNLFEQYKNGELELSVVAMLEMLSLLKYLCDKHKLL